MLDQELTTYLDAQFREISRQIAESREDATRQVARLREEFEHRFDSLERRFDSLEHRFDSLEHRVGILEHRFDSLERRFESLERRVEHLEATGRQTLVLVEGLRDEVHLIAEGYVGVIERLERYQSTASLSFDQVKDWVEPYFRDVDRRVGILEGRSDRLQGNVMDAIRKLVGRPPLHEPPVSSE
jgi:chromosome segregation ATPase